MPTKVVRKIIKIDEQKCNGCGDCALACAEWAIQIVDSKARLVSERYCDGLGACIGECPQDALTIEERECVEFDEAAVEQTHKEPLPCGCPSTTVMHFAVKEEPTPKAKAAPPHSRLTQWPVQLSLVPSYAPFLQGAELLLVADCVPFAYAGFHQDLLEGHAIAVACPKLDNIQAHQQKLTDILRHADIKSLTVVHMEMPCCFGLVHMAQEALKASGKTIPFKEVTAGIKGDLQ